MIEPSFPYQQCRLENDLVALVPFEPKLHASAFLKGIKANPELFTYIDFPALDNEEDFISKFYNLWFKSAGNWLYAVIDKVTEAKTGPEGSFAGSGVLMDTNPTNAATEIGILIFPAFQRSHVASNVVGLLLQWTLDPPSQSGLGLRRVKWTAHADNESSRRLATRMGFELEGILRWERVCPGAMAGLPMDKLEKRNGTTNEAKGRHTAILSIVWDEWDQKRPAVMSMMELRK